MAESKKSEDDLDRRPGMLENPVKISRTDDEDTLINVHVHNPLKKITKLLEEIKKQKAFSFSIKGSLGIAGIALVITSFGIFGGTKAFCTRGSQTFMGSLYILSYENKQRSPYPFIDQLKVWLLNEKPERVKRMIVLRPDSTILHLQQFTEKEAKPYMNRRVFVTGDYDACSEIVTITEPNAVQYIR